jgi:NDP-sugar pyrophosphorylase family protein
MVTGYLPTLKQTNLCKTQLSSKNIFISLIKRFFSISKMSFKTSGQLSNMRNVTKVIYGNQLPDLDTSNAYEIIYYNKYGFLTSTPSFKLVPLPPNSLDLSQELSLDGGMSVSGNVELGNDLTVGGSMTVHDNVTVENELNVGDKVHVGDFVDVSNEYKVSGNSVLNSTTLGSSVIHSSLESTSSSSFTVGSGNCNFVPLTCLSGMRIQTRTEESPNSGSGTVLFDLQFRQGTIPKVFVQIHPSQTLSNTTVLTMNVYNVNNVGFSYVKFAVQQLLDIAIVINGNSDPFNVIFNQEFDWLAIGT